MPEMEKVIKGLECCTRFEVGKQLNNCLDCPYIEPIGFNQFRCKSQEMKEDALALLKEQEAVKPVKQVEQTEWTVCGNCRNHLISKWIICPNCGRKVKWDG